MNRFFTTRNLLVGLVLVAGGLAGPVVAQLADDSPEVPAAAAFATRTPSPTITPIPPSATPSPSRTPTATLPPSTTPLPSATWTPSPTPTDTPMPVPEGMVLVPAGHFRMGSARGLVSEAPEHPVLLDAFYLDRFEVTNADYQACVEAGVCRVARLSVSFTRASYRDNPEFANYPVIGVTWDDASAYCQWAGKRLPSEAEWEYAASGPENYTWPWGNEFELERSAASGRDTQPVASFPAGVSPFGAYNMAGNVAEWVADVYDLDFFETSPPANPLAAGEGYFRIYRGGSFQVTDGNNYTTSRRIVKQRTYYDVDIGFRCAQSALEVNRSRPPEARQALVAEFCALYAGYRPGAACP